MNLWVPKLNMALKLAHKDHIKEKNRVIKILTHRISSPLETVVRRRVLNPAWSIPENPPMLGPKKVSNRSKGLVCRKKKLISIVDLQICSNILPCKWFCFLILFPTPYHLSQASRAHTSDVYNLGELDGSWYISGLFWCLYYISNIQ